MSTHPAVGRARLLAGRVGGRDNTTGLPPTLSFPPSPSLFSLYLSFSHPFSLLSLVLSLSLCVSLSLFLSFPRSPPILYIIRTSIPHAYDLPQGIGAFPAELRPMAPIPWGEIEFHGETCRNQASPHRIGNTIDVMQETEASQRNAGNRSTFGFRVNSRNHSRNNRLVTRCVHCGYLYILR